MSATTTRAAKRRGRGGKKPAARGGSARASKWRGVDADTKAMIRCSADELAVKDGCRFDATRSERVAMFFERFLVHSKGEWAGRPFELLEWQRRDVIAPLFGWVRPNGTRRFRLAYIEIPKKNGKSTLAAGIVLYMLAGDGEAGAEVYSAAADRKQASIVYKEAAEMVKASPELSAHLELTPSVKVISFASMASSYEVLSRDAFSAEGKNAHCLAFDELHAQRDRRLWDALRFSGAARRQPLIFAITTAGFDVNSVCWEQHDYAEKVRDGIIPDTSFFGYIRAADREDDWTKPEVWRKANPSLGVTMNEEDFAADCREAQNSPVKENAFKRYRLNVWTEQETRWLPLHVWDKSGAPFDPETLLGRPCWAGLDMSSTQDLTALTLVFDHPERPGDTIALVKVWSPEENARERELRERAPYVTWAKQGYMTLTPGNVVDHDRVFNDIVEIGERYDVRKIGYDPFNASQIAVMLAGAGFEVGIMRQGFLSMNEPSKALEKLVLKRALHHGGHPVLRWCVSNTACETDAAGNIKPSKKRSREKIDCVVSTVIALGVKLAEPIDGGSVYDTRGLVTL